MKEQQLVTVPLNDLIWSLLGDDAQGLDKTRITQSLALILAQHLKDSLKWKVEFETKDGEALTCPLLWRYSEWYASSERYMKAKLYAEKERIAMFIRDANVENMARAIMKTTRMSLEDARPTATMLVHKGNVECMMFLGLKKWITNESEL